MRQKVVQYAKSNMHEGCDPFQFSRSVAWKGSTWKRRSLGMNTNQVYSNIHLETDIPKSRQAKTKMGGQKTKVNDSHSLKSPFGHFSSPWRIYEFESIGYRQSSLRYFVFGKFQWRIYSSNSMENMAYSETMLRWKIAAVSSLSVK